MAERYRAAGGRSRPVIDAVRRAVAARVLRPFGLDRMFLGPRPGC